MVLSRNKTGDLQGVGENLCLAVHVKEHVRIIRQYRKIRPHARKVGESTLKFYALKFCYGHVNCRIFKVLVSIPNLSLDGFGFSNLK